MTTATKILLGTGAFFAALYLLQSSRRSSVLQQGQQRPFNADDARAALQVVKQRYGTAMAKRIEQVARLESAHFNSAQYKATGTGGMEVHGPPPFYGWYSNFFLANPTYTPVGTIDFTENGTGLTKTFVIMPSVEAWMMFLADYATRYANQGGILRWYSTNAQAQANYANSLNQISTPFVNSFA